MADSPLFEAAYYNRIDDLIELLSQEDLDINVLNGTRSTALIGAAVQGHIEAARLLLENGADIAHVNQWGMTALGYAVEKGHKAIVELLKNPPPLKRLNQNPDQVIFTSALSNRTMEEVFNFVSLERITLIRNGRRGPVEAVTRESFSVIADESALRKAFDEHVKRGGKADESAVFPNKLPKNKLPRPE